MLHFAFLFSAASAFLFSASIGCNCSDSDPKLDRTLLGQECPPSSLCSNSVTNQTESQRLFKTNKLLGKFQPSVSVAVIDKNASSYSDEENDMDLIYDKNRTSKRRARRIKSPIVEMSTAPAVIEPTASSQTDISTEGKSVNLKCNSELLRKLMSENIGDTTSLSKRRINKKAEELFGGSIDVICSKEHFSYIYSSNLYCETTKGDITCVAYRQAH